MGLWTLTGKDTNLVIVTFVIYLKNDVDISIHSLNQAGETDFLRV